MGKHDFKKLKVWQLSKDLAVNFYKLSKGFPKEEMFGLTSQLKRCAVSIPSNISEGCGRGTDAQLSHFLNIAQGSAAEMETQLIIAFEVGVLKKESYIQINSDLLEVQKMINGFQKSIKNKYSHSS